MEHMCAHDLRVIGGVSSFTDRRRRQRAKHQLLAAADMYSGQMSAVNSMYKNEILHDECMTFQWLQNRVLGTKLQVWTGGSNQ
jgi:hypothetical protein